MKLDILAFGAHPDDVELACSGTLLKHVELGKDVGIIDLTKGEMGTRGTPAIRLKEAKLAAEILGAKVRENLGMADAFFVNDKKHQLQVIQKIRQYKPDVVLANALVDRHPDHERGAKLVSDACFLAGLEKIKTSLKGKKLEAWRPKAVYHYNQFLYHKPDITVNITAHMKKRIQSIRAHTSQFYNSKSKESETMISKPEFFDFIISRCMEYGKEMGVTYAEGFMFGTLNREDFLL